MNKFFKEKVYSFFEALTKRLEGPFKVRVPGQRTVVWIQLFTALLLVASFILSFISLRYAKELSRKPELELRVVKIQTDTYTGKTKVDFAARNEGDDVARDVVIQIIIPEKISVVGGNFMQSRISPQEYYLDLQQEVVPFSERKTFSFFLGNAVLLFGVGDSSGVDIEWRIFHHKGMDEGVLPPIYPTAVKRPSKPPEN